MKSSAKLGSIMYRKLILGVCALLSAPVFANTLTDVKTAELPGERFEIRMTFSDTPPEPSSYTIERPARIVLDFPNVDNTVKDKKIPLSYGTGQSAMLLSSDGRTRLVVNLNELATYKSHIDGKTVVLEVGGSVSSSKTATVASKQDALMPSSDTKRVPAKANKSGVAIEALDFRRGQVGEGRVVIKLSDPHVSVNLEDTGAGVRLTFTNVSTPSELRKRLDVVDFATPVSLLNVEQKGADTVLSVTANGEFDHMAYQTDTEYVLSIKPLTEQEKLDKKKDFQFNGEKLSFNFQDIEVRAVLQIIADFTELNLVASDTVSGRITLRLDNVPWDQALALVLKTKGLDKRQEGNVLMIAPASEIAERERQELSTRKQLEELAPLRTEYLRVRYASAKSMFELFRNRGGDSGGGGSSATGSVLSARGQAIVDERTNSIIITDTADRIENFKKLVNQIDIPIRQVLIEARIVIANSDFRRELGIRWGGVSYGLRPGKSLTEIAGGEDGLSDTGTTSPAKWLQGKGGTLDLTKNRIVDLGVSNPTGVIAAGVLMDNTYLDMELSALENGGYAEIVSQPKVITSDKQSAVIKSGTQIPYQEASASGSTSTSFKDAVLMLNVTPQITPDNNVIMDLNITKDAVGAATQSGVPTININSLQTKVLVPNGETIVLGGVFGLDSSKSEAKVPVLGDLPYLGHLFKRTTTSQVKTELLIFITPKIIADKMTN